MLLYPQEPEFKNPPIEETKDEPSLFDLDSDNLATSSQVIVMIMVTIMMMVTVALMMVARVMVTVMMIVSL